MSGRDCLLPRGEALRESLSTDFWGRQGGSRYAVAGRTRQPGLPSSLSSVFAVLIAEEKEGED